MTDRRICSSTTAASAARASSPCPKVRRSSSRLLRGRRVPRRRTYGLSGRERTVRRGFRQPGCRFSRGPRKGPSRYLAVTAAERLEAGEGARPGRLAGEVDAPPAGGVVRPDGVRAASRIERDRDRVGEAPVRIRHGGAEDAERADTADV